MYLKWSFKLKSTQICFLRFFKLVLICVTCSQANIIIYVFIYLFLTKLLLLHCFFSEPEKSFYCEKLLYQQWHNTAIIQLSLIQLLTLSLSCWLKYKQKLHMKCFHCYFSLFYFSFFNILSKRRAKDFYRCPYFQWIEKKCCTCKHQLIHIYFCFMLKIVQTIYYYLNSDIYRRREVYSLNY